MKIFSHLRNWEAGRDLLEYAMLIGFLLIAAGAVVPRIAWKIESIVTRITIGIPGG